MKIYCSHSQATYLKSSNYYSCRICTASWYGNQSKPLVQLGCTEVTEVDPNYYDKLDSEENGFLQIKRCFICHDVIKNRTHYLCNIKEFFQDFQKQQRWGFNFTLISVVLIFSVFIGAVIFK